MEKQYLRPSWTCGRYDSKSRSAIYYNLLSGFSFYYEEDSADVIGIILSQGRNKIFTNEQLSKMSGICQDDIDGFLKDLCNYGLLTTDIPTTETIQRYRAFCADSRKLSFSSKAIEDKLPIRLSTSEMDYTDKVDGITFVMLELTYRCSERCIHCYNPGATRNNDEICNRGNRNELSLEQYKSIIDQLYENGLIKVCLSGGDPFSNKYSWDIIRYLYDKEIAVDIFTNGLSIYNKIDILSQYYPHRVAVSIYSGVEDEHDEITRVRGSWKKTIQCLDSLTEYGIPTSIKCCVMMPNFKNYHSIVDIAKKYGAEPQIEVCITDSVEGDLCVSTELRLPPELLEIILQDEDIPYYVGNKAPNFGGQKKDLKMNSCNAGLKNFCITPEGYLIPCCSFHMKIADLKSQTIEEATKANTILSSWLSATLNDYIDCGKHDYCDYCNMCAGLNYSEHKDFKKAAENACYFAKVRYNLAKKLMSGQRQLTHNEITELLGKKPNWVKTNLKRIFK